VAVSVSVELIERFYAILAIAAIGAMVVIVALRVLAVRSDPALDAYAAIARAIEGRAVIAAWLVALLATVGSLYFSEVAGFVPCTLCWYQRIAMYPLVVILGLAALRREHRAPTGAAALAAIGAVIAGYHVALEWIPSLETGACAAATPCTFVWFRAFGVFSLPTLALTAFLLILLLLRVRDPDASDRWSDR
jgi:disulfide bond formation protein DsbB